MQLNGAGSEYIHHLETDPLLALWQNGSVENRSWRQVFGLPQWLHTS